MAGRLYGLGILAGILLLAGGALASRAHVLGQRNRAPVAGAVSVYTPRPEPAAAAAAPLQGEVTSTAPRESQQLPKETEGAPSSKKGTSKPRAAEAPPRPVNINTAAAAELQTLPGIGPVMANRIVSYRNEHGPFKSTAELDNVKGIGPKKLEKLAPYILVE
jgi:competence protein ComEA